MLRRKRDQLGAMRLRAGRTRGLGRLHQVAAADDVGRQDRRQPLPRRRFARVALRLLRAIVPGPERRGAWGKDRCPKDRLRDSRPWTIS